MKKTGLIVGISFLAGALFFALFPGFLQETNPVQPQPSPRVAYAETMNTKGGGLNFAPLVKKVKPAVVKVLSISKRDRGGGPGDEWLDKFFDFSPRDEKVLGVGSGFFISSDGYIITNNHVVENAIKVRIKNIEEKKLTELTSEYILTSNPEPVTRNYDGYIYLELPRFKSGFDAWNLVQFTGDGNTPVRLDFPLEENYSYEISLPSEYLLFTPETEISIKNDLGELEISISQSGTKVKVERSWELYKDVISSDLMDEFKEMIVTWEKVDYRKIVLKQNPR